MSLALDIIMIMCYAMYKLCLVTFLFVAQKLCHNTDKYASHIPGLVKPAVVSAAVWLNSSSTSASEIEHTKVPKSKQKLIQN